MGTVSKEIKQRYWKKKAEDSPMIQCNCGCGGEVRSVDDYGRKRNFINGHNRQKYEHTQNAHLAADYRWRKRNPAKTQAAKVARYRKKKIKLILMKGGKCERCGFQYDGNNGTNFQFHHPDPGIKEGTISGMIGNKAFATVLKEMDKCALVCSHCHGIIHNGEW